MLLNVLSIMFLILFFASNAVCEEIDIPFQIQNCTGIWSASAKSPSTGFDKSVKSISSPDGKFSIVGTSKGSEYEGLSLVSKADIYTQLEEVIGNPWLIEVLWSPDSRVFAINTSNGGQVGDWHAYFYVINKDGRPAYLDIEGRIAKFASKFLRCETFDNGPDEELNYGAATWLSGGKEVLIIGQVPNHSLCRNMKKIMGFRVSIKDLEIIEQFSEDVLRRDWESSLGCFLKKVDYYKGGIKSKGNME